MHSLIDEILEATRAREPKPLEWVPGEGRDMVASAGSLKSRGIIPIIAEIKPRILGRQLQPDEVSSYARIYEENCACAISVLTQPTYFLGSLENLRIAREASRLPVLRKDFIFDERQLKEAQADLVLLIAALGIDLNRFVDNARSLGMEPIVEVHTQDELENALNTDARIIGINNRNLRTLEIHLGTFELLAPAVKDAGVFLVAESGVKSRADAIRMADAGADAILVGTSLMEDPKMLAELNEWQIFINRQKS